MSKHCKAEWIYLVFVAVALLRTTNSIQEIDCERLTKSCLLITQCVSAVDLIKVKAYGPLRKMFCGYDVRGPKVCCPVDSPVVFTNDTETTTSRVKTTPTITTVATTTETGNQYGLPSRQVCGLIKTGETRIVGGLIASIEEFPWLVRVKSRPVHKDRPAVFNCGGSLISDRHVLTAGHCVYGRDGLSVRLGEWDTVTSIDCQDGTCSDPPVDINVTKVILHQLYDRFSLKNDIALLLLEKAANFTDYIRPVCLPITEYSKSKDYVEGTKFWTAGWGVTEFGKLSIVKRKVDLDTILIDVCVEKFPQVKKVNLSNIICAGGTIGKDTCNGDSGGPLVKAIVQDNVNWYLYGITSFGTRHCGMSDKPSVYTRVTSYMDWIIENIVSS